MFDEEPIEKQLINHKIYIVAEKDGVKSLIENIENGDYNLKMEKDELFLEYFNDIVDETTTICLGKIVFETDSSNLAQLKTYSSINIKE